MGVVDGVGVNVGDTRKCIKVSSAGKTRQFGPRLGSIVIKLRREKHVSIWVNTLGVKSIELLSIDNFIDRFGIF